MSSVPEEGVAFEPAPTGFLDRLWVPPVFFVATVACVFYVGLQHGAGYYSMLGVEAGPGRPAWLAAWRPSLRSGASWPACLSAQCSVW